MDSHSFSLGGPASSTVGQKGLKAQESIGHLRKKYTLHNLMYENSSDNTEDNRCPDKKLLIIDELGGFSNDPNHTETAPERLAKLSQFIDTLHLSNHANDI